MVHTFNFVYVFFRNQNKILKSGAKHFFTILLLWKKAGTFLCSNIIKIINILFLILMKGLSLMFRNPQKVDIKRFEMNKKVFKKFKKVIKKMYFIFF